jgi:outer membrane receptor protein involved in Fe transport
LDDLLDSPGAETVDFDSGRVKPRAIADLLAEWTLVRGGRTDAALSFWVNNLTNQTYAFNYGNPFSGTHFGARRRVGVALRLAFGPTRP